MNKKILIAEDDRNVARALTVRLRAEGYDVVASYDGVTAVCMARKEVPDLVVLDISMPAGDGFTTAERIQDLSVTAGVPMIFVTASKRAYLRPRALELGAQGFFEKPYEWNDFLGAVRSALAVPQARSPAPDSP